MCASTTSTCHKAHYASFRQLGVSICIEDISLVGFLLKGKQARSLHCPSFERICLRLFFICNGGLHMQKVSHQMHTSCIQAFRDRLAGRLCPETYFLPSKWGIVWSLYETTILQMQTMMKGNQVFYRTIVHARACFFFNVKDTSLETNPACVAWPVPQERNIVALFTHMPTASPVGGKEWKTFRPVAIRMISFRLVRSYVFLDLP